MVAIVTDDSVLLDNADVESGDWVEIEASGAIAADAISCQGVGSLSVQANGTGLHGLGLDVSGGGNVNMAGKIFMAWAFTMQRVALNGSPAGWRMRISTNTQATSNYIEWDIAGRDTSVGTNTGFQCFAVAVERAASRTNGTPPATSSVAGCCVLADLETANGRTSYFADLHKVMNVTFVKGTAGLSSQISADDSLTANARGTFQYVGGAYFLLGEIQFGDSAGTTSTSFADTGIDWLFQDMPVELLHGLSFIGNTTGTNTFTLGTLVGTGISAVGVNGGLIHRATNTSPRWFLDATNANISVKLHGVSMSGGQTIKLEGSSNIHALSCTITDCDTVSIRNGALIRCGTIITDSNASATLCALDLGATDPVTDSVRDIQVNNSATAILLKGTATGTTTFNFRNIKMVGNTTFVRIDFPAGATVVINILEGGTAFTNAVGDIDNVNGSTVTVNANTSITFNKLQDNTEVRVFLAGTQTEIAGIEDAAGGTAGNRTFNWSYSSGTVVDYQFINNQYKIIRVEGFTIPSNDVVIDVQQQLDLNY